MVNICRICLGTKNLVSLFQPDDAKLSDKIMFCASVHIVSGDDLPSHVCSSCVERLNTSYDFKVQCEHSDKTLRENSSNLHISTVRSIKNENTANNYQNSPGYNYETSHDEDQCNKINKNNINKNVSPIKRLRKRKNINNSTSCVIKNEDAIDEDTSDFINDEFSLLNEGDKESSHDDTFGSGNEEEFSDKNNSSKRRSCQTLSRSLKNNKTEIAHNKKRKKSDIAHKEQCFTCGKVMSSRFRLKMHMRIHTGEKPFTCSYCNKKFALSQNLKVHERVHTGEKPLMCGTCGRAFAQSAGLVNHMRVHTGETPYKCTLCTSSFRTTGHLQYHIRQHTGEKNFECTICNKAFIAKGDLTQHTKTHTGERPYVCTVCGFRLFRASHLTRHMMTHTGEKPHKCTGCGSSYTQKGDLARHIKRNPNCACTLSISNSEKPNEMSDKNNTFITHKQNDKNRKTAAIKIENKAGNVCGLESGTNHAEIKELNFSLGLGLLHSDSG